MVDLKDMEDEKKDSPPVSKLEGPPSGVTFTAPGGIEWINLLVYGGIGSGKTHLLATAYEVEEMYPILYLDAEKGTLTIKKFKIPEEKMRVIRVNKIDDLSPIYEWLARDNHGFKTVVLDSLTEVHSQSLEEVLKEAAAKNSNQDEDVASQREWGKSGEQIKRMVRAFRDLPMHALFAAGDNWRTDGRDGKMYTQPDLPGQLARKVPGYVDECFYLYTKLNTKGDNTTRYALTQKTPKEIAKDRSGNFPLVVEEPTMTMIYDTIFKEN